LSLLINNVAYYVWKTAKLVEWYSLEKAKRLRGSQLMEKDQKTYL
jgi:hypothetical protein